MRVCYRTERSLQVFCFRSAGTVVRHSESNSIAQMATLYQDQKFNAVVQAIKEDFPMSRMWVWVLAGGDGSESDKLSLAGVSLV